MSDQWKLSAIKSIHTLIWIVLGSIVLFVVWSGITGSSSIYSWIAVACVLIEGLVLLVFGGSCPLTVIARRYSSSTRANFDIYLPNWLAKYNKQIFGGLFALGLALMLINEFSSGLK